MEVESDHLKEVDWNEGVLSITFRDGSTYEYRDVPVGVFQELLASESKSAYFRQNIKGSFEYAKV